MDAIYGENHDWNELDDAVEKIINRMPPIPEDIMVYRGKASRYMALNYTGLANVRSG